MTTKIITRKDWVRLQWEAAQKADRPTGEKYVGCHEPPPRGAAFPALMKWPKKIRIIPREEWPDLIKAGKGSFLSDLRGNRLRPHDQRSTSRCWVHGSVRAIEVLRLWEVQKPMLLSPDSVAFPIEGTRDRGGYPGDACQQLAEGGACPQSAWPEAELSPRHADGNWKFQAEFNRLQKWLDVTSFPQQMTLAIHRIPVPIGLRWWGHLVCQLDPILIGRNEFGMGIDNSWGSSWGDNGYGILDEESATADLGAFAPITQSFFEKKA